MRHSIALSRLGNHVQSTPLLDPQVKHLSVEENQTLSLVLPENWHFVLGDINGFIVQII